MQDTYPQEHPEHPESSISMIEQETMDVDPPPPLSPIRDVIPL